MILAIVAGLVTIDIFERGGLVGEGAKSESGAGGAVLIGVGELLLAGLAIELEFFEGPETNLPPGGDGHRVHEAGFYAGFGFQLVFKAGEVGEEVGRGFRVEDDGFREDAVADGVAGGTGLAFWSDGSAGFGAVGARSLDAKNGTHSDWIVTGGGEESRGGILEAIDYRGNILLECGGTEKEHMRGFRQPQWHTTTGSKSLRPWQRSERRPSRTCVIQFDAGEEPPEKRLAARIGRPTISFGELRKNFGSGGDLFREAKR